MKTNFNEFTITAEYTGSKPADWGNGRENWNHHRITVYSSRTNKRTGFDFWASIMNPHVDSRADVLSAFECFVSDALAGRDSFEDFCAEFGYDTDSRRAERTWKACKRSWEKLIRVSGYDINEIYALANSLQEVEA